MSRTATAAERPEIRLRRLLTAPVLDRALNGKAEWKISPRPMPRAVEPLMRRAARKLRQQKTAAITRAPG